MHRPFHAFPATHPAQSEVPVAESVSSAAIPIAVSPMPRAVEEEEEEEGEME